MMYSNKVAVDGEGRKMGNGINMIKKEGKEMVVGRNITSTTALIRQGNCLFYKLGLPMGPIDCISTPIQDAV